MSAEREATRLIAELKVDAMVRDHGPACPFTDLANGYALVCTCTDQPNKEKQMSETSNSEYAVAGHARDATPQMKVGAIVRYHPGPSEMGVRANGAEVLPAIVTRVWGMGPHPTVNMTIFCDDGQALRATSVQHMTAMPAAVIRSAGFYSLDGD